MIRFLIGLVACLIATNSMQGLAGDEDPIRKKLDKAKAAYVTSREKYSKDVATYFDNREKEAEGGGITKVDEVKAERAAFDQSGDLPPDAPDKLRNKLDSARSVLAGAFEQADRNYTKVKMFDQARDVVSELRQFLHDRDAPWVKLFNGKNTTGWHVSEGTKSTWQVQNNGTLSGNGGLGYLITDRNDYANFRLRVEAMLLGDGEDSGICFRVQNPQVTHAYEANIHNGRAGDESMGTLGMFLPNGGVVGFGKKGRDVPAGQWFTMEVRVEGNQFTTWVNGEKACEAGDPEKRLHGGPIALQQWTGTVSFRKVEIKELPN